MSMTFAKAVKHDAKGRIALAGPAGSGKTYTALKIADEFAREEGLTIGVIDTEHGSASKYSDTFDFVTLVLEAPFHPNRYIEAINAAADAGIGLLIIDSLTHAYNGSGGLLEIVDEAGKRFGGNSYAGWKVGTPIQQRLIEAILGAPMHLVATMRSKQDYVQDKDDRGRTVVRKVGMAPQQRDGMEYEFDLYVDLDIEHNGIVQKSRCPALADKVLPLPGANIAVPFRHWLKGNAPALPGKRVEPVADPAEPAATLPKKDTATVDQVKAIRNLLKRNDLDEAEMVGKLKVARLEDLTPAKAGQIVDRLLALAIGDRDEAQSPAPAEAPR